jgi:hypothetical protein
MTVGVALAETLAAGILLRRLGRWRAVIPRYIELAIPVVILVLVSLNGVQRLFAGWFTGHGGHLLTMLLALVFLVLAITAGLRGWHWLVRGLLHLGWLGSLILFTAIEMARVQQPGR